MPVPTLDKSSPTAGQVVAPGDTIHYKIVVGNTGNFPITASPLVDTLPTGVTYTPATATSSTTGGGSVDSGPVLGSVPDHGTMTWTITLPTGATATVEFDALVGNVPQSTTLTNKAEFEKSSTRLSTTPVARSRRSTSPRRPTARPFASVTLSTTR